MSTEPVLGFRVNGSKLNTLPSDLPRTAPVEVAWYKAPVFDDIFDNCETIFTHTQRLTLFEPILTISYRITNNKSLMDQMG